MLRNGKRHKDRDASNSIQRSRCGAPEPDKHIVLEGEEGEFSPIEFPVARHQPGSTPENHGNSSRMGERISVNTRLFTPEMKGFIYVYRSTVG